MSHKIKDIKDEKPYLELEEMPDGDMRICIYIPPYNIDDLKAGFKQKLTISLSKTKVKRMRAKFDKHKHVVAYVDGACTGNPGPAGGGVAFFGRKVAPI